MLNFAGKTVIITGAGGGLGREYALLFANRGASVVVNDLGSSSTGDGKTASAADKVVQEIRSRGGIAVANYDSVENGEKLVKAALEKFGRIDIIVNNAGILRDKQFKNLTDSDWDVIFDVHVKGAFKIVKAVWHHMCAQKYGRIIFTSSNSGIYGNFGQVNYSSAKAALIGFSKALAKEGQKYNIFSNVIVPTASSRLTKSVIPDGIFEKFDPRFVAPMVAYLCHESCPENGGVFEAAGGWFGKLEHRRNYGKIFPTKSNEEITPEKIRDSWSDIADMTKNRNFETVQDECFDLVEQIDGSQKIEETTNCHFKATKYAYTPKDAILYAISIGATVDKHLHLLYESHENFTVFPLFAVVPCSSSISKQLIDLTIPNINLDFAKLLHGEQYFEFKKPFKSSGCVTTQYKLVDILNKGDSAILLLNVEIIDENNEPLAVGQYSLFFRDAGNFGGHRESKFEIKSAPIPRDRKPDFVVEERTNQNQASLYRQTGGDYNPIHIDPSLAQFSGFSKPILHGLCTLGFAVRHLLDTFSPNDYSQLRTLKVRFTKPVLPGQTLVTEMWRNNDGCVQFQTKVKENDQIVIGNAYATCFRSAAKSDVEPRSGLKTKIKSRQVFDHLKERLSKDPDVVGQVQAIYLWIITQNGEEISRFTIDLKNGKGSIYEGDPKNESAGVAMTIDDQDMVDLVEGKLNPQKAFMTGRLKLKGNIMLSQKLQRLFNNNSSKL